jgi:hypothetical protein
MSSESRLVAGILLILMLALVYGGEAILHVLVGNQDTAEHIGAFRLNASVLLVLSLVALRYVDEAALSARMKWLVRYSIPAAAILLPLAFFVSMVLPEPEHDVVYLAYAGVVLLAIGLLVLGGGLIRERWTNERPQG